MEYRGRPASCSEEDDFRGVVEFGVNVVEDLLCGHAFAGGRVGRTAGQLQRVKMGMSAGQLPERGGQSVRENVSGVDRFRWAVSQDLTDMFGAEPQ